MDAQILLWIHAHAGPLWDVVFRISHVVGDLTASTLLVLTMTWWHLGRRERPEAATWLTLGLSAAALTEIIKAAVDRPRPELWPRIVSQSGSSFLSGHALAAASLYPLLARDLSRHHPAWAPLLYGVAILGCIWVGVGRLYLGLHWPTDVLAGWTLGALQSTVAIMRLDRSREVRP